MPEQNAAPETTQTPQPGPASEHSRNDDRILQLVRQIEERIRRRYETLGSPSTDAPLQLPDLMPLVHARDAAFGKVAAIGTVNPRPPGLINDLIQAAKRLIARTLNWFVREQVEFNHATIRYMEATLEALEETKQALARLNSSLATLNEQYRQRFHEFEDLRSHWIAWRQDYERKLTENEIHYLRGLEQLQADIHHRTSLLEENFKKLASQIHHNYEQALTRSSTEIQQRLWQDLDRIRTEYEQLIHRELRLLRQRLSTLTPATPSAPSPPSQHPQPTPPATTQPAPSPSAPSPPATPASYATDIFKFLDRFRGSEEEIQRRQRFYLPYFANCRRVLDLGCGRGEFLTLMREAGISAYGIDESPELVNYCTSRGLEAYQADALQHLRSLPDAHLDGIFCAHVIEHLPPATLPELFRQIARVLTPGGTLALETPNPHCLLTLSHFFFNDPTHLRPVPRELAAFYLEEAGFRILTFQELSPAADLFPELNHLPEPLRRALFNGLDYTLIAHRL